MTFALRTDVSGAELTTLACGGPVARVIDASGIEEIQAAVAQYPDALCIGQGSNLVVSDDGFAGTIIRAFSSHDSVVIEGNRVIVPTSLSWDVLVQKTIAAGLQGLEATSGVPGSVGGGLVQNAGAYGQEIADCVVSITAWDRQDQQQVVFSADECGFAYRTSRFKSDETRRYILISTTLKFTSATEAQPRYGDVSTLLSNQFGHGGPYPLAAIRIAVLDVRTSKGMIIGTSAPSAGSFFTNPALDHDKAAELESLGFALTRRSDGTTQVSAAALMEGAGFARGDRRGRAGLSPHHVLALINADGANSADVLALAKEIRDKVHARFAITLKPEPVLLGFAADPFA